MQVGLFKLDTAGKDLQKHSDSHVRENSNMVSRIKLA